MIPVIIPAYEPSPYLIQYIRELIEYGFKHIIVIDDGSGEAYRPIFDEIEAIEECIVLRHAVNMGKGRALKDAFNFLLVSNPNIQGCVTADSDGQHRAEDVLKCVNSFRDSTDSLVLGCRNFELDTIPAKSKFGNKLTRYVCKYLVGLDISDTQTGLRVVPRELMKISLTLPGERFEFETNMLIACKERSTNILEEEIETVYDSKTDHVTHFDSIRDSIRIYKIFAFRFVKYILSSLSSCILDLLLFTMLCNVLRNGFSLTYVFISTCLARVVSSTYNFIINYAFVFNSKEHKLFAVVKYYTLAIVQMLVSGFLVTEILRFINANETVIKAIVDTTLFFVSYAIQRKHVYKA